MCINFLGRSGNNVRESRTKKELAKAPVSLDLSLQSKDVSVRIVHAGGREEMYQNVVPASELLEKYPGMCVARPEVFKSPQGSILCPEEMLLPGQKYYIIPSTTAQKLKHKHLEMSKRKRLEMSIVKKPTEGKVDMPDANISWDAGEENSDESIYSAKEFYVSKERLPRRSTKQLPRRSGRSGRVKKPFVPPLPRSRTNQGLDWEPSLISIQELSP